MEKYKIEKKLGQGVHSTVFKVKDLNNNFLVVKEIECTDVSTSCAAYEEYKSLTKLNHKYLGKVHDVYVKWNKDINNSLCCFVMDFYYKQDLLTYLKSLRDLGQSLSLEILKKFFGMILDGMYYLHNKGIIHRNLKPNSIYLYSKLNKHDLSECILQIGDFGIMTIMKDARTKTRLQTGAFDYAAPEVIDLQEYNEKSDIWSIGCVLLDMATTAIYDYNTFRAQLLKIRYSDDDLNETLDEIFKVYENKKLNDFLKYLLNKNASKRPNYKFIFERSFARECLSSIDSQIVNNNKSRDAGPSDLQLPSEKTILTLIQFIKLHSSHESRVQTALIALSDANNLEDLNLMDFDHRELLIKLLTDYVENIRIQSMILNLISISIQNLRKKSLKIANNHLNDELLQNLFYVFIKHSDSIDVQLNGCKLLVELSHIENALPIMYKLGIAKYLLKSLAKFKTNTKFCGHLCKALWCLAINERLLQSYRNLTMTKHLKNTLLAHKNDLFCVEMAMNAVVALTMDERILNDEELETNLTSAILIALDKNLQYANIVKSACHSLASLIRLHDDCAFRFIYVPKSQVNEELEGIILLIRAYQIHKDNSEIVEIICQLISSLCIYDEMIQELKSLKLRENLVEEISKRYRDNQNITKICILINHKLK